MLSVHDGVLEERALGFPRVKLGGGDERVVDAVDLALARRPARRRDDEAEPGAALAQALDDRVFADAGRAGDDDDEGRGREGLGGGGSRVGAAPGRCAIPAPSPSPPLPRTMGSRLSPPTARPAAAARSAAAASTLMVAAPPASPAALAAVERTADGGRRSRRGAATRAASMRPPLLAALQAARAREPLNAAMDMWGGREPERAAGRTRPDAGRRLRGRQADADGGPVPWTDAVRCDGREGRGEWRGRQEWRGGTRRPRPHSAAGPVPAPAPAMEPPATSDPGTAPAARAPSLYQGVDKGSAGYKLLHAMGWREGQGLVRGGGVEGGRVGVGAGSRPRRRARRPTQPHSALPPLLRAPTGAASRSTSRSSAARTRPAWAR